ncbi:tetratricopeptide repeat protein, partial [Lutimonas sp.]|uniref:tetratricopeptide repeat protein n=1 Tax=Lutimonas sp. TaxID=1872403 RepID=UPI003D9ADB9F
MHIKEFYKFFTKLILLLWFVLSCDKVSIDPCVDCDRIDMILTEFKSDSLSILEKQNLLNQAEDLCEDLESDSLRSLYLFKISNKLFKLKNYQNFRNLSEEYLQIAITNNDTLRIADYYWNMGIYYSKIEVSDSAFFNFKMAGQKFRDIGHNYYEAKMDYNMAFLLRRSRNYIESEAYAYKSIMKLDSIEHKVLLYRNLNHLGLLYYDMKQYDHSENHHEKALDLVSVLPNKSVYLERTLNNLSLVYQKQQEYELAIQTINQALENKQLEKQH